MRDEHLEHGVHRLVREPAKAGKRLRRPNEGSGLIGFGQVWSGDQVGSG
jgi:hypothetical protein